MKTIQKIILTLCLIALYAPVFADNDALILDVATNLLQEGKANDAYAILLVKHNPASTNPQEWFLLGLAAKRIGKPREASKYFEKVIALDPQNSGRAKLEIAALSYSIGDGKKAKDLVMEVKAKNQNPKVGENIDRFLEAIAQGTPRTWRITGNLGWMYDSNANAGPDTDSVILFGLPFTLSANARKTNDNASMLRLGFDHFKGLTDDMSWQSSLAMSKIDYNDLDNLDYLTLSASTGPTWRLNSETTASMPLVVDWVKIGHDRSYYYYSYGFAPQIRYKLMEKLSLNFATIASKKKYKNQDKRNLDLWRVYPSLGYEINKSNFVRFGFNGGQEHSGLNYYSNKFIGVRANYYHTFQNGVRLSLNASYTYTRYKEKEAAYDKKHRDKMNRFGFDLSFPVKSINSELLFSSSYTKNDSNLVLYDYDRTQVFFSLKKRF